MNRKDQDLLRRINSSLSTLSFIEQSGVDTFDILQSRMKNVMQKRDEIAAELRGAKDKVSKANELVACINKIGDIESHIEKQKAIYGDAYTELEDESEVKLYNAMQKKLAEAGLHSDSERQEFMNRMDVYKNDYKRLVAAVQQVSDELYSLDDIYRDIGSIPTAQESYSEQLHEYQIERFGEEKEKTEERSNSHEHEH
ncbi:MAG TPA: hypothetical protein DEP65_13625 [Ruminococcus sp.]|nr:hypothetical protein [Ruminococcus sp.]